MFEATFLGHQGWLFTSGDTRLLVDPLLRESFCDAGKVGRVFPPRRFDFERFPAVDAVFFSHEHDDHFAIATLQRLERRIPVFLSSRSSQAARRHALCSLTVSSTEWPVRTSPGTLTNDAMAIVCAGV